MNLATHLMQELAAAGVRVEARPGGRLHLSPKAKLTPDLIERVRAAKPSILECLRARAGAIDNRTVADKCLAIIARLRCYTIAGELMPVVRMLAETLTPLAASDPDAILIALQDLERELISLGAAADPVLADAVAMVAGGFPGAKLVEVRPKVQ